MGPVLLPHHGEARYGGAVKLLAVGAPRSVDLEGYHALEVVAAARMATAPLSFCP